MKVSENDPKEDIWYFDQMFDKLEGTRTKC